MKLTEKEEKFLAGHRRNMKNAMPWFYLAMGFIYICAVVVLYATIKYGRDDGFTMVVLLVGGATVGLSYHHSVKTFMRIIEKMEQHIK